MMFATFRGYLDAFFCCELEEVVQAQYRWREKGKFYSFFRFGSFGLFRYFTQPCGLDMLQQNTGLNTTGYINKKRLEHAAKLLKKNSDDTIQNVAYSCGLPNIPTFNRLSRSKFGMTPTEYRKTM